MKPSVTLLFLLLINASYSQVTNVKTGVWSDLTIWNNHTLPTDTTNIVLSYDITIDINAVCKSLHTNGHKVMVNTGVTLNVSQNKPTTDSTFTDPRDGQVYKFKHIGSQVWMTQNLNYYTGSGSWCYDDNPANCAIYGRLYDWNTALASVPPGWHVPSDSEWTVLENYLGSSFVAGDAMKDTTLWEAPNIGATNSSGFTALPGGYRNNFGVFYNIGYSGSFWSTLEDLTDINYAWNRNLSNGIGSSGLYKNLISKVYGYSVRCVKDTCRPSLINFSVSSTSINPGESIIFKDETQPNPSNISWAFPGGTPSASSDTVVSVKYNSPGDYMASLTINGGCKTKDTAIRVISDTSNGSITDIDGNVYNSVKIGTQYWTQQNLNVSHYRNGDTIPEVKDPKSWGKLTTGAWL